VLGVRPRPLGAALRTGRDHRCTHTPSIPPPPPCALLHRSFFGLKRPMNGGIIDPLQHRRPCSLCNIHAVPCL